MPRKREEPARGTSRSASAARTAGAIALGLLVAVALVEAILQAGAFAVWWRHRDATGEAAADSTGSTGPGPGQVVLCMGDSFTFGLGSARPATDAWPRQLQSRLDASPGAGRWSVHASSWPGENSALMRARLPSRLQELHPSWVCLLIGANDRWNAAEPPDPDAPGRWTWKWRVPRLLALVRARTGEREKSPAEASAPGAGSGPAAEPARPPATREELLAEIGRLQSPGEDSAAEPDPADRMATTRRVIPGVLALAPAVHALDDPEVSERFVGLLTKHGLVQAALTEGTTLEERHGLTMELGQTMVFLHLRLGNLQEADAVADRMMALDPDRPDPWRARSRVDLARGKRSSALRAFVQWVAREREADPSAVDFLVRAGVVPAEIEAALASGADEPPLSAHAMETVRQVAREAHDDADIRDRLRRNVADSIAMVRASGARPLLITYPSDGRLDRINAMVRDLASEQDVPLAEVEPVFEAALARRPHDALFVADGHCTTEGYGIIADVVARELLARTDAGAP